MTANAKAKQLVAAKMAAGLPRDRAAKAVFKEHPGLRAEMCEEANANRLHARPRRPAA